MEIQKRFSEFQRTKKESILAYKDKIHIVIYGVYNPPGERERLIKLRDRLKTDGYTNTAIVEEFLSAEGSSIPNLEKSLDPKILWKSRIFEEIEKEIPAMETLLKEELSLETRVKG